MASTVPFRGDCQMFASESMASFKGDPTMLTIGEMEFLSERKKSRSQDRPIAPVPPELETEKVRRMRIVDELNFTQLKGKMCLPVDQEGKGYSAEYVDGVERLYKGYLKLTLLYPKKSLVPTKQVDEFWHTHILDTKKYHDDCQRVFGFYLHHYPYFGLRGKQDAKNLVDSFTETCQLFAKHFGDDVQAEASWCRNSDDTGSACMQGN